MASDKNFSGWVFIYMNSDCPSNKFINIIEGLKESEVDLGVWYTWVSSAFSLNVGDPILKISSVSSSKSDYNFIFIIVISNKNEGIASAVRYPVNICETWILIAWNTTLPIGESFIRTIGGSRVVEALATHNIVVDIGRDTLCEADKSSDG